jgi:hypothetical protein
VLKEFPSSPSAPRRVVASDQPTVSAHVISRDTPSAESSPKMRLAPVLPIETVTLMRGLDNMFGFTLIGCNVHHNSKRIGLYIKSVRANSPAARDARLLKRDRILQVSFIAR